MLRTLTQFCQYRQIGCRCRFVIDSIIIAKRLYIDISNLISDSVLKAIDKQMFHKEGMICCSINGILCTMLKIHDNNNFIQILCELLCNITNRQLQIAIRYIRSLKCNVYLVEGSRATKLRIFRSTTYNNTNERTIRTKQ
jgi:hypothetical protein